MTIQITNAERLAMEAQARAWEPSPPVDYVDWAGRNIVLSPAETPFPGRFNIELFPHLAGIFAALSPDDPCRVVTVKGSAQIGKTVIANVFTCGSMDMDPSNIMVIHPTEDNAARWSKLKLAPMLRSTSSLALMFPEKSRDGSNSVLFKERADGRGAILISGANSPSSLSQVSMPRQVQDDLSKWENNVAGDPEAQGDSRSRAFEFAKILKLSTPLIWPGCRITKNYEDGSQEQYYVPCPHCQHMQVLEWENMLANTDADQPEQAHFVCSDCGGVIEEHHRPHMIVCGEWRAHNPSAMRQHRSFYIWSAYSLLQSWELIFREWLKAKGEAEAEKTFLNDAVGQAYRAKGEAPPWEKLRDRAAESAYGKGTIPVGALLIALGIDCQGDRVEWQLVGFGRDFRRFVIDYGVIPGHISEANCQERIDALLKQTWRNSVGRQIGVDMAAIDGNAYTEDVWAFARRHPASKLIMVRGIGSDLAPRLARVKKERHERTGKLLKYSSRFYNFGANIMKFGLYRDLGKTDPMERGHVSFPSGLDDEYYRQLTAEHRVQKFERNGATRWVWDRVAPGAPNEALDTMLQAETAANKWGLRGLPEAIWAKLEQERETPMQQVQGDLEDLLTGTPASPALPPTAAHAVATPTKPSAQRVAGRRVVRSNYMS